MNPSPLAIISIVLAFAMGPRMAVAQEEPAAPRPSQETLADALASADRIVVTEPLKDEPLFEISSPTIGRDFVRQFEIDEDAEGFHCMCYGDGWITFYAGDSKLAKIGFHHAQSIRWIDGPWSSDARLKDQGGITLSQWFRDRGYPGFENFRLRQLAWREAEQKKQRDFAGQLPPELLDLIRSSEAPFGRMELIGRRALAATSDKPMLIASVFRAFGQVPTETTGYDFVMGSCREIVEQADGVDIATALVRIENDPEGLRGAAFLFCAYPFHKQLSGPAADVWPARLAEIVFTTFHGSKRPHALLRLISSRSKETDELLVTIADKRRDFPLPEPYERGEYDDEPDLITGACLVLAMRHHPRSGELAQARAKEAHDQQGTAALQIAAALVTGTPGFSKEVFQLQSHLIGFAALQLLEEMPLDQVPATYIGAALDAPWGAVREDAERLAAKLKVGQPKNEKENNDDEVRFDANLASEMPEDAIAEFTGLMPKALGTTKARLLRARSTAYAKTGRLEQALADISEAREIDFQRDDPLEMGRLLWQLGRAKEAERQLSSIFPLQDPWALETRGLAYLSNEQYSKAERDLSAAALMDSRDPYRLFFQHLAAILSGHVELSRLRSEWAEAILGDDEWTPKIAAYLLGELSESDLISASHANTENRAANEAEALFYIAAIARTRGDLTHETEMLRRCLELNQVRITEHWLAKARIAKLSEISDTHTP